MTATTDPILFGRSFTVNAELVLDKANSLGAIMALGSRFGGWSFYLDQGRPAFTFAASTDPDEILQVRAERSLPQGASHLKMRFAALGAGKGGEVVLSSGDEELARVQLPTATLMPAGNGETLDVGRDLGVPVTDYRTAHGRIEGDVPHVTVDLD